MLRIRFADIGFQCVGGTHMAASCRCGKDDNFQRKAPLKAYFMRKIYKVRKCTDRFRNQESRKSTKLFNPLRTYIWKSAQPCPAKNRERGNTCPLQSYALTPKCLALQAGTANSYKNNPALPPCISLLWRAYIRTAIGFRSAGPTHRRRCFSAKNVRRPQSPNFLGKFSEEEKWFLKGATKWKENLFCMNKPHYSIQ